MQDEFDQVSERFAAFVRQQTGIDIDAGETFEDRDQLESLWEQWQSMGGRRGGMTTAQFEWFRGTVEGQEVVPIVSGREFRYDPQSNEYRLFEDGEPQDATSPKRPLRREVRIRGLKYEQHIDRDTGRILAQRRIQERS